MKRKKKGKEERKKERKGVIQQPEVKGRTERRNDIAKGRLKENKKSVREQSEEQEGE